MTIKQANKEYILSEERKYLGKEIGNFFAKPKTEVAGYESISVELMFPLCNEAYNDWVSSAFYNSLATWDKSPENIVTEMLRTESIERKEQLLLNILKDRPISVALEGAVFSFRITGVPRTMTHQIVRHRKMAFGQQSFRVSSCYAEPVRIPQVLFDNSTGIPEKKKEELRKKYIETIKKNREVYRELIINGVPMEQARNIMPMGTLTAIGATMQLRTMIEYFRGRTSDIAQDEHTYIVCLMANELRKKQPKFFKIVEMFTPSIMLTMKRYLGDSIEDE